MPKTLPSVLGGKGEFEESYTVQLAPSKCAIPPKAVLIHLDPSLSIVIAWILSLGKPEFAVL